MKLADMSVALADSMGSDLSLVNAAMAETEAKINSKK